MQNIFTYLSLFLTVFLVNIASAQNEGGATSQYEQGMKKAFQLWQDGQPWEAANLFERIAKAEPDNWLPPYYVAQINVVGSFGEKDKEKLTAQLNKAQDFINDAKALSKDNPDIMVLQAQLYTAWIVFDGRQYGMIYSPKASELYEKALAMEPDNPRLILANAEWKIGSAKYFGESLEPYCKEVQRALELFDDYKPKGQFYPRYGKERAEQVLADNCN